MPSTAYAVRSFTDEVNRVAADNPMHAHPDDFELYLLGHFDEDDGTFDMADRRMLARAKDVKQAQ